MSSPAPTAAATCFDCGYDLRGLPPQGRCPECGLAAAESARRFNELLAVGAVVPVRRATLCLLLAAAIGLGTTTLLIAVGLLTRYFDLDFRDTGRVMYAASFLGSLATAGLVWRASVILNDRPPQGGRLAGRLLGLVGWVVPVFAVLVWAIIWLDPPRVYWRNGRASFFVPALVSAVGVTLAGACLLYLPALVSVVRRRVTLWPQRPGLARGVGFVAAVFWVALALMLPSLADAACRSAFGSSLFNPRAAKIGGYELEEAADLLAGVGTMIYSAAVPTALICLCVVYAGAGALQRRLERPEQLPLACPPSGV